MISKTLIKAAIATAILVSAGDTALAGVKTVPQPTPALNAASPFEELAKIVVAAHGGEKLRSMSSLVLSGTVELTVFNQATPATFVMAIAGERYSFVINNPFQPLKQVFDGKETFSSLRGFALPPVTSIGFPVLAKVGSEGYVVSAPVEGKKKVLGFRVTGPDGYYTDFIVDEKSKQLKGYESSYEYGERKITTSVEIESLRTVSGVLVPDKYYQRFDLGQMTAYAGFKAKEIKVNSVLDESVFAIPK